MDNSVAELPCILASNFFRQETRALRPCLRNGQWGATDLTTCTLQNGADTFLLLWFVIETNEETIGFSSDGTPDDATRLRLEEEVSIHVWL